MRRLSLVPLLLVATACSTELADQKTTTESSRTHRVSQGIVNGTPSVAADNAVVFISMNGSTDSFCTGTFVAPNLVLTARHCVGAVNETSECGSAGTQMAPSALTIRLGVKPGNTAVATATKIFVDSAKGTNLCSNDIALFQLDKDVPGAMVAKVRLTKLDIGETARTVGYGDDGSGKVTNGRYAKTGIKIDSVGPSSYTYTPKTGAKIPVTVPAGEIVTGESTCFGDSGGPLFDSSGSVIGVTSRGIDEKCIDRPSIYSDTASHAKFITDAAAAAGHPLGTADATPTVPDGETAPQTTDPSDEEADDSSSADEEETEETPTKKKKKSSSVAPAATGCSTSPGSPPPTSSSLGVVGLALGAILALRRKRAR